LSTIAEGGREVVSTTSGLLGKKMLLATDGSMEAELATKSAVELADSTGSELHVVYVEPLPDFMKKNDAGTPGYDRELYEMIEEEGREKLRKLTWRVKVAGGTVTGSHLRMGAVAGEIGGLADDLDVDLIIVGSRGLHGIRRALAGSVSEGVFRHARCPVMVVRAKGDPPSQSRRSRKFAPDPGAWHHDESSWLREPHRVRGCCGCWPPSCS
jgi:nucleotide-binding universal stress UspA family protein